MRELTPAEKFVAYALQIGALEIIHEGRKLKSGRLSPYFFNSGLFNTGISLDNLATAYVDAIVMHFQPDIIYGPAYKGIPLCAAIAMKYSAQTGKDVRYVFNRKEVKDHGEGGILVGLNSGETHFGGKNVLIVDDVITSGTSSNEAYEIISTNNGIPIGCVIGFDRQEIGTKLSLSAVQVFSSLRNIPVKAAATLSDLISLLKIMSTESDDDETGEILEKIISYKKEYGATVW